MDRHSEAYQDFLDKAFTALSGNLDFQKALLATGDEILTHSYGKTDPRETILTIDEFCDRLMTIRKGYQELNTAAIDKGEIKMTETNANSTITAGIYIWDETKDKVACITTVNTEEKNFTACFVGENEELTKDFSSTDWRAATETEIQNALNQINFFF